MKCLSIVALVLFAACGKSDDDPCPLSGSNVRLLEWPLTCTCTGTTEGVVIGSGPYKQDSHICAAAVHQGAVRAGEHHRGRPTVGRIGLPPH